MSHITTAIIDTIGVQNFLIDRMQGISQMNNDNTYLEDVRPLAKSIVEIAIEHIKYDFKMLYCFIDSNIYSSCMILVFILMRKHW